MMCVRTYMYVFVTLRNVTFRNVMAKTTRQLSNESVNHTRNVTLSNVTHCADSVDRSTIDVAHGDSMAMWISRRRAHARLSVMGLGIGAWRACVEGAGVGLSAVRPRVGPMRTHVHSTTHARLAGRLARGMMRMNIPSYIIIYPCIYLLNY